MLSKLSKDSKKSRGRKERAKGRSLFRDVLDTVEVMYQIRVVVSPY